MKGTKGAPPTDLLVCFPSRSHLSLMPKQICSPVRPNDASKRHHHHLHNQKGGGGQAGSPLLWAKTSRAMGSEMDEPTSPKVTCAGQIKVRPKPSSCKNWQSVMEEIERLHKHNNNNNTSRNNKKHKNKKATWGEALGFKKDVMQFLTCLRGLRFDLRCFGSFQGSDVISDDDDDDEEGEEEEEEEESEVGVESSSSRAVFSKWYMVLQENKKEQDGCDQDQEEEDGCGSQFPSAPPPNALLLMRCRSAPAKSWLEEKEEEEEKKQQQNKEEEEKMKEEAMLMEEEKRKENLILRCYSPDFFKVSSDVAKETWVVGGVRDNPLSRSRSWKR